jgi:hypothetical protein
MRVPGPFLDIYLIVMTTATVSRTVVPFALLSHHTFIATEYPPTVFLNNARIKGTRPQETWPYRIVLPPRRSFFRNHTARARAERP